MASLVHCCRWDFCFDTVCSLCILSHNIINKHTFFILLINRSNSNCVQQFGLPLDLSGACLDLLMASFCFCTWRVQPLRFCPFILLLLT